jgi:phage gp37-like protein
VTIKATRDAIVSAVAAKLPGLRACEPYDGRFSETDLQRVVATAPAVFVSCMGISEVNDEDDDIVATAQWLMTVVTRRETTTGRTDASRTDAALAIIETLTMLVRDSNTSDEGWPDESAGRPEKIRAANLFSAGADAKGLTLWALTWEQDVSLAPWGAAVLDNLLTVETVFRMGDTDADDDIADSNITTTLEAAP